MAYYSNQPPKDHAPVVLPPSVRIQRCPMRRAYTGSYTWAQKGGMMGGSSGSCAGTTSGNGIGVVPQAFHPA